MGSCSRATSTDCLPPVCRSVDRRVHGSRARELRRLAPQQAYNWRRLIDFERLRRLTGAKEITHADEVARHDRLIELVARRPATRKLQRAIDAIGEIWRSPDHLQTGLGGYVHWRVEPSLEAIQIVAAHHRDSRAHVRRAVFVALSHGAPHGRAVTAVISAGLADEDGLVRVHAARAAAALDIGEEVTDELSERLTDPVWTVRWNAALALSRTARRADAAATLLASEPLPAQAGEWATCARAFQDVAAIDQRLRLLER